MASVATDLTDGVLNGARFGESIELLAQRPSLLTQLVRENVAQTTIKGTDKDGDNRH